MLAKLQSVLSFISSKISGAFAMVLNANSSVAFIIGALVGYLGHPIIKIAIDIIKIPFKLLNLF